MRKILLILSLLIITKASFSQEIFSLKDCMNYAIENSPKYKIQEAKNKNTDLDFRESYLNFIPSISASVSATTNFGRSIDPETNTYTNTTSFNNSYGIYGSYTIFNGFSTVNNYKIAKTSRLMGVEEAKALQDDICLQTVQAYYNVLYYTGMLNLAKEQLQESENSLKNIKLREELGLSGQSDVLQAEAIVATNDLNLIRQENNLEQAILALKAVMFFPKDENLIIDTIIANNDEVFLNATPSETLVASAKNFLPSLKIGEQNLKVAEYRLNTAKWRLLPRISMEGGYSTGYVSYIGMEGDSKYWEQLVNRQGQYIYVGMSIPIFSALSLQGNVSKNKNLVAIAQYEYMDQLNEVETEVLRAVQDLNGSVKEFHQAQKQVESQELAHKLNTRKYEEGLISILELHSSSNQLLAAKAQMLNSHFQYLIKNRVVKYYNGEHYIDQK
ncbi:TolC family protein [Bacteroidales bacterium OttesenSCG-928-K03]|nr:TolC family protein [Bacteroidales bacterium OttesenSCG-928-L14]MDL2240250.1 TolC family protein [Bacteroidales bacterium OttesenSCG-928-K22]MDL2242414.1 TolC family protein [Bacteroidales bacterium OttesenSCG-928-K03]